MVLAIVSISNSAAAKLSSFCVSVWWRQEYAAARYRDSTASCSRVGGLMSDKIFDYDPAAALESEEAIAVFLADALETGDSAYIAKAMGVVARAKGMSELARETGLSREQLYRSFSEQGNPTLKTMLAVMRALGVDLTARPHEPAA